MATFIIDWRRLNTNKFWIGLWFTLCHPIYAWKYDRNVYGSFLWKVINFFEQTLPSYTPFSKASRWLAHKLVHNITDTKYLDTFYCRKRGDYTTYYKARALFGHFSLYELYRRHRGKGYDKKPRKTKIVSGWCWRKKTAIRLYKEIVINNPKMYKSKYQTTPEIANPMVMDIVENMSQILVYGKLKDRNLYIDSHIYETRYKTSKDNIEKLWCYIAHLLSCPNDFRAHEQLAWMFRTCDNYLYYKEMKKNPKIDTEYNNTLKKCGEKAAKNWLRQCISDHKFDVIRLLLLKQLADLRDIYMNEPFNYYRV